ncbi:hypothetical protein GCM10010458_36650 [Microbacterium luteolum]|uniref:Uncharacterized protein n=1 Tax=Microbacterium luteolum TaxID=69367 RepID=A0ABY7XKV4_MICLT|nr:hypothetical protein [Microbacterium luteolum]WDM42531.1 hypothetical protein KV395_04260 [Microbacterium luteolum]
MTLRIRQTSQSIKLARELVSIATNIEFGDLRGDMVESRVIKETEQIQSDGPAVSEFIARLMGALVHAMTTVEVLVDEIARDTAAVRAANAVLAHPEAQAILKETEA